MSHHINYKSAKILPKEKSRETLEKLFSLFQSYESEKIDKYLNSKPVNFFNLFTFDSNRLPTLFWDGKDAKKIFDSVVSISGTVREKDGKVYGIGKYEYLTKLTDFIESKGFPTIYAAGNWECFSNIGHDVISLKTNEIKHVVRDNWTDLYFFDRDFKWMLAFNNFRNGFLAGDHQFIQEFTEFYPDYRKFANYGDSCNCQ